ncbi:AraC-type DNA-binding protein [Actinacidiphila alni]|uniref:AraC-type DNA-binding protein n=2 Tax=Actinacidiphila alni TaxID=380248 RepID=A0A1I1ZGW8_9ACTN|nr:AraC-type DNA-binding protein [Actinacidiphila alni]
MTGFRVPGGLGGGPADKRVDTASDGLLGGLAGGLRAVPHPAVTLLLTFGDSLPVVDDGTGPRRYGSLVAGPGFGAGGAVRAWGADLACVQIRLSPLVARAVLGVSPAELGGAMVTLDEVWGPAAARVRERLGAATTWEDRFAVVDAVLAAGTDTRTDAWKGAPTDARTAALADARTAARSAPRGVDPEVARAWHRIRTARGLVRVDGLAAEVGWSRKRLWSRFQDQLGVAPKRAARLVRFDHAVHRLVAGDGPARVAAETGYADQSHLHREVMTFTGLTPAAAAAEPFLTIDDVAWPRRPLPLRSSR